ncbi:hypothetical protein SADUNF_Sadunf10G0091200 [Salix dunnii]|uniref:Pentatricopeptide repeat-containing protein n=1 Tax=Salix dunnii TaxID=1413687 RepID=A0A835JRW0_9ROSI|nr:hypothetical protein SADUNF_Sadunf10G0091200 [Salix dunnii]
MEHAHKLFDQIPVINSSIWNVMFRAYSPIEFHEEVKVLFRQMKGLNALPSCFTFPLVLKSRVKINALKEGEELDYFVIESGFSVSGCYVDGHGAEELFIKMPNNDVISWKTVLNGHASNGDDTAYSHGYKGNVHVGNSLIDMCAKCGVVETAFDVFKTMDKKYLICWNTIIGGFAMPGQYRADALNLFSQMKSSEENLD